MPIWPFLLGVWIYIQRKIHDDITIRFLTLVLVVKDICLTGSVRCLI
jgi:hypothetical protein